MVVSRASLFRFTTIALVAVSVPGLAAAQSRGGAAVHAPAVGHAVVAVMHVAPAPHGAAPAIRAPSAPSNTVRAGAQPRMPGTVGRSRATHRANIFPPADFSNFEDVPGLGFDFPHFAAINANRPHRGRRFGNAPFFGGFLLTSPSVIIEQPAPLEEPPAEDVAASNVVEEEPVVRRHRRVREPEVETSAAPAAEPAPQRDMEQFVFVRRDGSLVFAVGYTWVDETLRYITPEGLRRTIDRDALDLNATQQFNEQRGVMFRAPA